MDHQQWQPVVLRKNVPKHPFQTPHPTKVANHAVSTTVDMKKLDEDESYTVPTMTRELGQKISQARTIKKWSQDDLAKKCSIPLAVVKEYEMGKGIYDRKYLDPLAKILNITLSRPQKHG